jgi:hypothetical protein
MPVISRFHGIVIFMNFNDHEPPHFHARCQDQEVTVDLEGGLIAGKMSRGTLRFVLEWSRKYRSELEDNWQRARDRKALHPIPPLS